MNVFKMHLVELLSLNACLVLMSFKCIISPFFYHASTLKLDGRKDNYLFVGVD